MGEKTGIAWCRHTFNAWWGCQEVGPECDHCYARDFDKRVGGKNWGKDAPRRFFGEKHWAEPLKWAIAAAKAGERRRVFCSSMADVFEDRADLEPERQKLWALIRKTAALFVEMRSKTVYASDSGMLGLDWLLLTKRPQNILKMCPPDVVPVIWAGATVGVKKSEWRIAELLKVPARVRFLSVEPQLEALAPELRGIDWCIQGGESGPKARPFDLAWARDLRDQCAAAGVSYFFKQAGARPFDSDLEGCDPLEGERLFSDRAGADPEEWPSELRVQRFPKARP